MPSKRTFNLLAGWVGAVLLCVCPAYAAMEEPVEANSGDPNIVSFVQQSVNYANGQLIGAVPVSTQWVNTAVSYTTVTAPASWSGYRFTHWSVDEYPAEPYRDAWGRSLNPISFVLYHPTVATAHYLPATQDSNGDGVPDWYKIEYYGTTNIDANSDTDGDGFTLLQEYQNGTHPLYGNTNQPGGVSWSQSGTVVVNLAGYPTYTIRSEPAGTLSESAIVHPGTVITTPNMTQTTFGYWELDGVRQEDAWGVAWRQISFTMDWDDREAVAYMFTGDSDGDGLPDAWEMYYLGSLDNGADTDLSGDGWTLLQNYQAGQNPLYGYEHQPGGVSYGQSDIVVVNLADFSRYTIRSEPEGTVSELAIVPDGTTITTPNMTQATFGYWELDGVRQEDAWGVALRQFSFLVDGEDLEAVAYMFTDDSDADGLPDAWEYYYFGTLEHGADADLDGDGFTLLQEYQNGTHPLYGNEHQPGGVSWSQSALTVVNLQLFPPVRMLSSEAFFRNPYTDEPGSFVMAGGYSYPALGDVDGDGDLDMIVGGANGAVRFLRNIGSPFAPDYVEEPGALDGLPHWPTGKVYPALGDWNGNFRADLAVGSDDGIIRLYEATESGSPLFEWVGNLDLEAGTVFPAFWAKANGADLLVLDAALGAVLQFENSGGMPVPYGLPATDANLLGMPIQAGTGLAVADTDDKGLMDVIASDEDGRVWRFLGQPDGSFFLLSKVWGGAFAGFCDVFTIAVVDFDGDGDMDIIGGGADGELVFLRNPSRHLRVHPAVATVGVGETIQFSSIHDDGTLVWSMGSVRSGGTIDPATGLYSAGDAARVDQVIVRNTAGRNGTAWINVVKRGGVDGHGWRAVLVDGRRSVNDPVWPAAHNLATRAREVLQYRGLGDDEILWLGHGTEADALPTRTALEDALRYGISLSEATKTLMVYMVDHGRIDTNGDGLFLLSENEAVSGPELNAWLDELQAARSDLSVVVMVESCYGALVTGPLAAPGAYSDRRYVLASSGADELAHMAANGLVSYSSMWWSDAATGRTLAQAHTNALSALAHLQTPETCGGGATLAAGKLAMTNVPPSGRPVVSVLTTNQTLDGVQEVLIQAEVSASFQIDRVFGVIVPPSYQPTGDAPVLDLPEVELARNPSTGLWQVEAGGFIESGAPYTVMLQARDIWGQVSAPALLFITQAGARNRMILFEHGDTGWQGAERAVSLAEYAREVGLLRLLLPEDILFYADHPGDLTVNGPATSAALEAAVTGWANANEDLSALTIFLVGQGTPHGLKCANGDLVTHTQMKQWLDSLQTGNDVLVTLIVDSDFSGRFMAAGGGPDNARRIVITSTGPDDPNRYSDSFWSGVIQWLWDATARGRDIRQSFAEAVQRAEMAGPVGALFDDDGDGVYNKARDGKNAVNAFIGSAYITANDPPYIAKASAAMQIAEDTVAQFWVAGVTMADGNPPDKVWGEVLAPDESQAGSVQLWYNPDRNRYEGAFSRFSIPGRYNVYIRAGTPGKPSQTSPAVIIQLFYAVEPGHGLPTTENLSALALPLDGQAMEVETDAGGDWRIFLKQGQRVMIEAREVSARRDVILTLLGAGDQVLAQADRWGAGFGETINGWEAASNGYYIVRARFAPGGAGTAECSVRATVNYESGSIPQGGDDGLTFRHLGLSSGQGGWIEGQAGWYPSGITNILTAHAYNDYRFIHWVDSVTEETYADNPIEMSMDQNRLIEAVFSPNQFTLTVKSTHGTPAPGNGIHTNDYGTVLTNVVENTLIETGGTQYVGRGWTLAGHDPASGTSNAFVMTVTNNAVLTWHWTTNYWLETAVTGQGAITGDTDGWHVAGTNLTLEAVASNGWSFSQWTGDLPVSPTNANPLDLTMDQAQAVTAAFTANTYVVTFDAQEGAVPDPIFKHVTYGANYGVLATVTRTGYTFAGWWTGESGTGTQITEITEVSATADHTLYAHWGVNQYTLTFESAGGSAVDPITQDYGTAVTPPTDPSRIGHTFTGWNPAVPETMPAESLTLTAQWAINRYTLLIESAHSSPDPGIGIHTNDYGTVLTNVIENTLIETGGTQYVGMGWTLAGHDPASGTSNAFFMTVTNDAVLTWQWATNYWLEPIAGDGGSVNVSNQWVPSGGEIPIPATPDANHHFVEWTGDTEGCPTDGAQITAVMDRPRTITAVFAIDTYTLTYNAGTGGSIDGDSPQTVAHGQDGTVVSAVSDPGYHFTQWSAGLTDNPRQDMNVTNDITVTAWFALNPHTLTVVSAHGEPDPGVGVHTTLAGTLLTNVVDAVVTDGGTQYVNTGWTLTDHDPAAGSSNLFTMTVTNNAVLTWHWTTNYWLETAVMGQGAITGDTDGWHVAGTNLTLEAVASNGWSFSQWTGDLPDSPTNANPLDLTMDQAQSVTAAFTANTYVVTFDAQEGAVPDPVFKHVTYGANYGVLATVTRTGYTFAGWWTGESGTGTQITEITEVSATADHTLYAHWGVNQYTLTFDSATGSAVDPITQDYGTAVTPPADPSRIGHTFTGWNPAVPETMPAESLTLTAQWAINRYTLTIESAHSSPDPGIGIHTNDYGTVLTNVIENTLIETGGTQYVGRGWTMTGNDPVAGVSNAFIMTVTNDAVLTWQWATNYWLDVEVGANGSVDRNHEWIPADNAIEITAIPDDYYRFNGWIISTGQEGGTAMNNPLILNSNDFKHLAEIIATFAPNLTTNTATPEWWLANHGYTNFVADTISDPLGKGMQLWEEYIAGTNPTNVNDRFELTPADEESGDAVFTFFGRTGRVYKVLHTDDVTSPPPWNALPGYEHVVGADEMATVRDVSGAHPRFYRITVRLLDE